MASSYSPPVQALIDEFGETDWVTLDERVNRLVSALRDRGLAPHATFALMSGNRREAFEAVGGFDESYVMYYEEVDLCYRMRRAGWDTRFIPVATVMHVGGAATRQRRQEMLVRLTLSSLEFHRHHDRGARLALARQVVRMSARLWLWRDTLRYHLSRNGRQRERLAQDQEVWREVLTRTSTGS